jgi:thioredoxin 1
VGTLPEISDATFEAEVVQADKPVLVDFWAPWCAPCRMVASVLEKVAEERGDALKIVKVNIDEHQEHAAKLGVMLLPTLLLYKDGKPVDKMQGSMPPRAIAAMLETNLGEPVAS